MVSADKNKKGSSSNDKKKEDEENGEREKFGITDGVRISKTGEINKGSASGSANISGRSTQYSNGNAVIGANAKNDGGMEENSVSVGDCDKNLSENMVFVMQSDNTKPSGATLYVTVNKTNET